MGESSGVYCEDMGENCPRKVQISWHQMLNLVRLWYYTKVNNIRQSKCHAISIGMLILLHEILDIYFGFVAIKCKFLYFAKFWNATRLVTHRYGCCFGEFVAWSTGYGNGSESPLGLKNGIGFRWYWAWFAWITNWMGWQLIGKGYQCVGCQARGLQSARAHTKCAGPSKVRRPTQSAGLRYECGGRQVRGCAQNTWAAVQLRGPHWVRGPQLRGEVSGPHCPHTSPAPAIQCPRNATAVPLAWAAMSRNRLAL